MSSMKSRYQSKLMTGLGSRTTARVQKPCSADPLSIQAGFWNLPQPDWSQVHPSQSRKGSQIPARRVSPNSSRAMGGSSTWAA
jgi:hypothetical protein